MQGLHILLRTVCCNNCNYSVKTAANFREFSTAAASRKFTTIVVVDYFLADCSFGDDFAPIQRAILPLAPDAQPLRPEGENWTV